jgi:hypothetical protein
MLLFADFQKKMKREMLAFRWFFLWFSISLTAFSCCGSNLTATPHSLLQRYITAVYKNQPDLAYSLLDQKTKSTISKNDFVAQWNAMQAELKEHARQLEKQLEQPLVLKATVRYSSGMHIEMTHENGSWKIDEGMTASYPTPTPIEALSLFLRAIEEKNYKNLLLLLTKAKRDQLEEDMADRVNGLKQLLSQPLEIKGDKEILRYGSRYKMELTKEGEQWKIQDFN